MLLKHLLGQIPIFFVGLSPQCIERSLQVRDKIVEDQIKRVGTYMDVSLGGDYISTVFWVGAISLVIILGLRAALYHIPSWRESFQPTSTARKEGKPTGNESPSKRDLPGNASGEDLRDLLDSWW